DTRGRKPQHYHVQQYLLPPISPDEAVVEERILGPGPVVRHPASCASRRKGPGMVDNVLNSLVALPGHVGEFARSAILCHLRRVTERMITVLYEACCALSISLIKLQCEVVAKDKTVKNDVVVGQPGHHARNQREYNCPGRTRRLQSQPPPAKVQPTQ